MPTKNTMEVDYTETIAAEVPKLKEKAKQDISAALEALFALEKTTRNAGDINSCCKVAVAIVEVSFESGDYDRVGQTLTTLTKRRGQEKRVTSEAVQAAINKLESIKDVNQRLSLLETLRTITEGKIFVETERAELTRMLANIYESQGKIKEAATVLQDVQVETLGKFDIRQKTQFILEQVRLCLDSKDYIRAQILSRKINRKIFEKEELHDLKLVYYKYSIRFFEHKKDYLEITRCYMSIYQTPSIQSNAAEAAKYLQLASLFIVLSPFNPEQQDLAQIIFKEKLLGDSPVFKTLLNNFLTKELIIWPNIEHLCHSEFEKLEEFKKNKEELVKEIQLRVAEHNIRVIAKYYEGMTMKRLAELLGINEEEAEQRLSDMVTSKSVYARIDRPAGTISFVFPQTPSDTLNEWSADISSLLSLMEKTTHLINREMMVHGQKKK